jgi:hypothetical protein
MSLVEDREAAVQDIINDLVSRFAFYRLPPKAEDITRWLGYFSGADRELAIRLLNNLQLFSEQQIQENYKKGLAKVPGWNSNENQRIGQWFFVGYGRASESGPAMLRMFREANRLSGRKHDPLFLSISELPSKKLTAKDTLVFVDDFSGTGKQVIEYWPTTKELLASDAQVFLILTAATQNALQKIETETDLLVITEKIFQDTDNIFNSICPLFNDKEKENVLEYCKKADRQNPKGFGDCGLLVVLSHKTPNNSIPILHVNKSRWKGLFPRYLQ